MQYKNITYSHEHVAIDLRAKGDEDCYLNVFEDALDEFYDLKSKGVVCIVDCSNRGMGRNIDVIKRIEQETGIQILWSTGYYKEPFLPKEVELNSIEQLSEIMIQEIKEGASFIAEIGTSNKEITTLENKVFHAACIAHRKTKCPIITHTTLGTMAREQVTVFEKNQVDLSKVIISHTDLANDEHLLLSLLSRGVNLAFDTIGKKSYLSDKRRVELISICCQNGYADQLFLSMDLTRKSHTLQYGGVGYAYLIDTFIPMLEQSNIPSEHIEKMVSFNMFRLLEKEVQL